MTAHAPIPTTLAPHDLECARLLAERAREMLAEAYKLAKPDNVLRVRAEEAGKSIALFGKSVELRQGAMQ